METADLAAIQAAGLHLGISTHGYFELMRARGCPSYIALGHIFPTNQSDAFAPQGLARLHRYRALMAQWPTVAIGGISEERVAAVKQAGSAALRWSRPSRRAMTGGRDRAAARCRRAGDEPRSACVDTGGRTCALMPLLSDKEYPGRQLLMLAEVGEAGQARLKDKSVLIVGPAGSARRSPLSGRGRGGNLAGRWRHGGFQQPAAPDPTDSEAVNHPRRSWPGERLAAHNPLVELIAINQRLDAASQPEFVTEVDLVIDCCDNPPPARPSTLPAWPRASPGSVPPQWAGRAADGAHQQRSRPATPASIRWIPR